MIVTRTPFRVTLGGGGTDLPSYYSRHGGFVFAMGIDKFMYIMLNAPIVDRKIRLHYSRSETVDRVEEVQHELAREALRLHGIHDRIEISSMADLPDGTGLGSSGSYLVGVLTALHHYRRDLVPLRAVAEEACRIELEILRKTVGKQDQYMAVFGGLTVLEIDPDGTVRPRTIELPSGSADAFVANTHLYYTGVRRDATEVLRDQHLALLSGDGRRDQVESSLHQIKEIGYRVLEAVTKENFDEWGGLLHEHWLHKQRLSPRVSLSQVDEIYSYVREEFGVLGGKVAGAGGGGFLMLYAPRDHARLQRFMEKHGMIRLHYRIEHEGSKVIADLANAPPLELRRTTVHA